MTTATRTLWECPHWGCNWMTNIPEQQHAHLEGHAKAGDKDPKSCDVCGEDCDADAGGIHDNPSYGPMWVCDGCDDAANFRQEQRDERVLFAQRNRSTR